MSHTSVMCFGLKTLSNVSRMRVCYTTVLTVALLAHCCVRRRRRRRRRRRLSVTL